MIGKKMCGSKVASSAACQEPLKGEQANEKIKEVAYNLYVKRGAVPGHELDDWLEAERIVESCA